MIWRKLRGNEHRDVASSLADLAAVLSELGKLGEAEMIFREALAMERKLVGNDHPTVAEKLHNLAHVFERQGKPAEAESMFREALTMQKEVLGNEHPDVTKTLKCLTLLLQRQGKQNEAGELLSDEIAAARESGNEAKHFDGLLERHAELLYRQSDYAAGEKIYRELIETRQPRLGSEADKVLSARASLARLLTDWAWTERSVIGRPVESGKAAPLKRTEVSSPNERAREAERLLQDRLAIRRCGASATH